MEPSKSIESPQEKEYNFNDGGGKGKETRSHHSRWDSVVDDRRMITFQPVFPKPEGVDLKGREVILAIAAFFFISVSIGLIVIMVSDEMDHQVINFSHYSN